MGKLCVPNGTVYGTSKVHISHQGATSGFSLQFPSIVDCEAVTMLPISLAVV